jgi:CubicO group peptidase (beta-lactamase class C family)
MRARPAAWVDQEGRAMDLGREIADWPVGSASVAVVDTGGIVDLFDDGNIHRAASVTKILTALTVLDAAAEGVVSLDDAVGPPGSTLRHLLSHASGYAFDEDRVLGPPGTRRIYSNRGIDVAADYLELRTGRPFEMDLHERLLDMLGMSSTAFEGSPAHGAHAGIRDLATLARELLRPTLLLPWVVDQISTLAFPGLSGVLPGFGRQKNNDWGLGCEIRDHKEPHWTAPGNSPRTFGHFGQSASFIWVDPDAQLACVSLCDTNFGPWAAKVWPRLSEAVLETYAS